MQKKGISADALKWIAVITMFIDHIGAVILEKSALYQTEEWCVALDFVLRYIGRLAFPIYCFLLVEGFYHTSNRKKYLRNLAVFAFLSEVPFDLAVCGELSFEKQNVFFTLLAGYISIWAMEYFNKRQTEFIIENFAGKGLFVFFVLGVLAELLHTDYGITGVALIGVLWALRNNRKAQCIMGSIILWTEITHIFAFLLIYYYNGIRKYKRGKYLFYAFYPVHLLLLYGIFVFLW